MLYNYITMQGAGNAKYSVRVVSNTHRHKTTNTQFRQIALPEETAGSYSELWCRQHVGPVLKYPTFVFVIGEG
jgi:hypothetical protein